MRSRYLAGAFLAALIITSSWSGIVNTKHNLSTSGTGSIKATSESEVCVFCHIPHQSQPGTPLWNRSMPSSDYTLYDSDYLRRLEYPAPLADLGTTPGTPGTLSRQCLSCHDGTVAVGSVYMVRGTLLGNTQIAMTGVNPDGTIPTSNAGYFGTDLRIHHPVGVEYTSTPSKPFGNGTRTSELKATPDSTVKLFEYAGNPGKKYVECSSCHNPHTETSKFLKASGANHAEQVNVTCTACHEKVNWTGSIHQTATNTYSDTNVAAAYGTNTVAGLGCVNCHKPHNGEGSPYLLRKVEEQTCFQGAASSVPGAACHGTGGAKDIQSVLGRFYSHPVINAAMQGFHTNLDVLYGVGVTRVPTGSKGIDWSDSKHVECVDCHNQHKAKAGTHVTVPAADATNAIYPSAPTNLIPAAGSALTGATGVEPSYTGLPGWSQPTTFATQESATKEYQICFKCHSYWGLGTASTGVSTFALTNHVGINATDQAMEFNPRNRSAHPIVMTTNQMYTAGGNTAKSVTAEGRYAVPLTAAALKSPWNKNPGNQTMYCSDCHGSDSEANTGTDPKGPHGSSMPFMLKGPGKYWPANSSGVLFAMNDGQAASVTEPVNTTEIFCLNCHIYKPSDGTISVHSTNRSGMSTAKCVECHVAVPHGSKASRLIGYQSMPAPYNYNGNSLSLDGIRVVGASNYKTTKSGQDNAYQNQATKTNCNCHSTKDGSYDGVP